MTTLKPGMKVVMDDPDFGAWHGHVVVCLCKRHVWQQQVMDGGPGRECRCGYPVRRDACRIPVHVVWDGITESHESPYALREDV